MKKNKVLISVSTEEFRGLSVSEARKHAYRIYKEKFIDKHTIVRNEDVGIKVRFERKGNEKTSFGGKFYIKKFALINELENIIKAAKRKNLGNKKQHDKANVIGYLYFENVVLIDNEMNHIRLSIRIKNNGTFNYSHAERSIILTKLTSIKKKE